MINLNKIFFIYIKMDVLLERIHEKKERLEFIRDELKVKLSGNPEMELVDELIFLIEDDIIEDLKALRLPLLSETWSLPLTDILSIIDTFLSI
jgi:hypothetical protein